MTNRFAQVLIVFLAVLSVSLAEEPPKVKKIEIRVCRYHDLMYLELPPDLEFSVEDGMLDWLEMDPKKTRLYFRQNSMEIYCSEEGEVPPTKVGIRKFEIGPGFDANPEWKITYSR